LREIHSVFLIINEINSPLSFSTVLILSGLSPLFYSLPSFFQPFFDLSVSFSDFIQITFVFFRLQRDECYSLTLFCFHLVVAFSSSATLVSFWVEMVLARIPCC